MQKKKSFHVQFSSGFAFVDFPSVCLLCVCVRLDDDDAVSPMKGNDEDKEWHRRRQLNVDLKAPPLFCEMTSFLLWMNGFLRWSYTRTHTIWRGSESPVCVWSAGGFDIWVSDQRMSLSVYD